MKTDVSEDKTLKKKLTGKKWLGKHKSERQFTGDKFGIKREGFASNKHETKESYFLSLDDY